jgi:rfaE bifunctional protein kinase chain/domain
MDDPSKSLYNHKIKSVEDIAKLLAGRPRSQKVIMCHGTFDVVHPGHIRHLLYAKTKAPILIASLTSDQHIKKGNMRPYVPEELRATNLAALEMVDYVLIDNDPTPIKNLKIIKPDYFAKGYEYNAGSVHPKTQEEINVVNSFGGEILFTPGDIIYSSSALLELEPPKIAVEKLMVLMNAEGITFTDLRNAVDGLSGIPIHVIGDTIVDSYTYCSMVGGMTKTPTMSVRLEEKFDYVGGAGVVAKHLNAAGAKVTLSTVLGSDLLKDFVLADLQASGITCLPIIDETRPTINKNAIIVQGYRMLKIDSLDNRSVSEKILDILKEQIAITSAQAVAFCDFRHGIFNRETVPGLISSIPEGVYRVADSQVASRWGNIIEFQNFDLITPNEREARFALGDQDSVIRPLAKELYKQSNCKTLMLKCGSRGLITYRSHTQEDYREFFVVDSFAEKVVDAVGAGDALLAYATLAMVATGNEVIASILGTLAAGIECEHDGNIPVTPDLILKKIQKLEKQALYS